MSFKKSQIKKTDKVFERAQQEIAAYRQELIKERNKFPEHSKEWKELNKKANKKEARKERDKYPKESDQWKEWNENLKKVSSISDGTKKTYSDSVKAFGREANRVFGVRQFKDITKEMTEELLLNKIRRGESAQNIRKTLHALVYFQTYSSDVRVFKEDQIDIIDHEKSLDLLRDNNVIRRAKDSHRYRATKDEAQQVIDAMRKKDPELANIAQYQLLTGFRISEAISQTGDNIFKNNGETVITVKGKGGLTNVVSVEHLSDEEKSFLQELKDQADSTTDRVFEKQTKSTDGRFKSDEQTRIELTKLASECAKELGIGGSGKTFSSHSFRGAYANERMKFYAKNQSVIDQIIKDRIRAQPDRPLDKKYKQFEQRIKNNVKFENRNDRKIETYEKIQWLVSLDLSHSRQEIARYYVSVEEIKQELKKYQDDIK